MSSPKDEIVKAEFWGQTIIIVIIVMVMGMVTIERDDNYFLIPWGHSIMNEY